jgi:hypothetical protein
VLRHVLVFSSLLKMEFWLDVIYWKQLHDNFNEDFAYLCCEIQSLFRKVQKKLNYSKLFSNRENSVWPIKVLYVKILFVTQLFCLFTVAAESHMTRIDILRFFASK